MQPDDHACPELPRLTYSPDSGRPALLLGRAPIPFSEAISLLTSHPGDLRGHLPPAQPAPVEAGGLCGTVRPVSGTQPSGSAAAPCLRGLQGHSPLLHGSSGHADGLLHGLLLLQLHSNVRSVGCGQQCHLLMMKRRYT